MDVCFHGNSITVGARCGREEESGELDCQFSVFAHGGERGEGGGGGWEGGGRGEGHAVSSWSIRSGASSLVIMSQVLKGSLLQHSFSFLQANVSRHGGTTTKSINKDTFTATSQGVFITRGRRAESFPITWP